MTILSQPPRTDKDAWASHAPDLAQWADRLVNRRDRHGHYLPMRRRIGGNNANTSGELTIPILTRHFIGRDVGDLIGLHSTSADGTCRWCAWDWDQHKENDPALAERNEQAATDLYYRLEGRGFRPILEDSNGRGGFHCWLIFSRPTSVANVYNFAQAMIEGLGKVETYPKQAGLSGEKLGNWLRLPGRHHTYDHWSRAYHRQGGWMEGTEAINELLGVGNE
jgi:putative DNA primase/helicase